MTVAEKNGFEGLVAQLGEAFNKAQAIDDDTKIKVAAGDEGMDALDADKGGAGDAGKVDGSDGADADDENKEDSEMPFGKSFEFELADGSTVQAFNGAELLKSFSVKLKSATAGSQAALGSALAVINKQNEVIEKQGVMLKALQADVTRLANSGSGRKSVTSVPGAASEEFKKSQTAQVSPREMLAKCLSAQSAGKITAFDSSRANIAVEMGQAIPADIVSRLV